MKQKNFSKILRAAQTEQNKENLKSEFREHFGSLYIKRWDRFKAWVKINPKKSFLYMMLLLVTNLCLMLYLDTRNISTNKDPFSSIGDYLKHTPIIAASPGGIEPTFSNLSTLHEIQDSLRYYSIKENLRTLQDTIALKKLLNRYAEIDPSLFKAKHKP